MSKEDSAPEPEKAEDSEDYINKRRLRDIFDARRELMKDRKEVIKFSTTNSEHKANVYYQKSIESYLLEIRPIIVQFDGEDLWEKKHITSFPVQPPTTEVEKKNYHMDWLGVIEHNGEEVRIDMRDSPSQKIIPVTGLGWVFSVNTPIEVKFEYKTTGALDDSIVKTRKVALPTNVLDSIVAEANEFLAKHGLDINPEQGLPEDELKL